jgi:hypothetical protein
MQLPIPLTTPALQYRGWPCPRGVQDGGTQAQRGPAERSSETQATPYAILGLPRQGTLALCIPPWTGGRVTILRRVICEAAASVSS